MNRAAWETELHGTEARAQRHRRQGHRPLRRYCARCADAENLAHEIRKARRIREMSGPGDRQVS